MDYYSELEKTEQIPYCRICYQDFENKPAFAAEHLQKYPWHRNFATRDKNEEKKYDDPYTWTFNCWWGWVSYWASIWAP